MRTLKDYNRLIESAKLVNSLTKSRATFKKKLDVFLAGRGNEFKLWGALRELAEYGIELMDANVELVKTEIVDANPNLPN